MSQIIIPDEWCIHDLKGENGKDVQRETFTFLEKIYKKCDKLAIILGSPFIHKFYNLLMNDSRPHIRVLSKYLRLNFLINSEKCVELTIVKELQEEIKSQIPIDKEYLYQIRQTLGEGIIITTDKNLKNIPHTYIRNEFLKVYS